MSDEPLPVPDSCVHNLHRVGDGRDARPEPTELCRNALGVFHMTDCPLQIGIACAYYQETPQPHPTETDLDVEGFRDELQRDFLGWRYRKRVRWLTKPKNLVPVGIVIECAPEPEEIVPESLAMRTPAPTEVVAVAPPAVAGEAQTPAETVAPAPTAAPERYPGQRRSEERLAKKKARLAAKAAAAKAAQLAALAAAGDGSALEPSDPDAPEDDEAFGDEVLEAEPVDEGPKTVEEVLARLPDAPIADVEPRRGRRPGGPGASGGPRQARPGEAGPRRRRRRGRRGGRGAPQGQRPGGGPPPSAPPS
jgi:hypothetical protein